MPVWLALGLVLGVGVADVSCGGKGDGGEETSVASGVTYAGPDSDWSGSGSSSGTDTGDATTHAPGTASGVTYAGPDETWTASEATTSGSSGSSGSSAGTDGSTGDTDSGTSSSTSSSSDASTYAGPDETGSTGP